MDPNEFEYVTEGMKWLAIAGGTYFGALLSISSMSHIFSKKIHNQNELDNVVDEEASKLGMDRPVKGILYLGHGGIAVKNEDGTYQIEIGVESARRSDVRHELYHVHREDFDRPLSNFRYWFVAEPRAIAYQAFGLKL
ncbi:MAG: hypothetical protein IIA87_05505 [Nanoarchaeota archaeon]|nr:hypothetical protein [Nanoarchaeota archaeon]